MRKYIFFQYGIKHLRNEGENVLFSKFLAMFCYAKRSVGTNPEVVSRWSRWFLIAYILG